MRPKGGSPLAPKARWVPNHNWTHLSPFWPQIPSNPKWPTRPSGPILAKNHHGPLFCPWPLVTTRGHQISSEILPLNSRRICPIPPCILYSRLEEWCIYGIIYHYAPIFISNSIVTFSGPNSMIPNQGPKIQCPIRRRTLQLISLAIHGGYQKTIEGPQPPGPAGVGLAIISGLVQGPFSEVIHHPISCQGRKYLNTPWTTQLVHTGSNQLYLYVLGLIGPIHNPLWEFNHTVQFSRWPELYWPNSYNKAGDSPSRISPSAFHIYWPPFITLGLFPQLINILNSFSSLFYLTSLK
ncbi:hypothetical protein O181_008706 [Austropuccinia psidii MF-1]|uniref:Uncharacterized protein n=1 Tax=Austropuccinia psidii MF-1 TaxID=1389203 RepID=A0A9Q3BMZ7_9BASI|nr:hypothetical protein [Austropuccinia psidii MF-1]